MVLGCAHFILVVREADYINCAPPKPYYTSIKYKIIKNKPYYLSKISPLKI